ncbi:hypothetical protein GGI04_003437 [Coemansia thaxteri]|nr:hypothetical protein GGI04_003437 [Coemansia thaxteri]KAJ2470139.1 hypothetical protein GGI02_003130 [Coemansia sp. RSA 2322]
MAFSTPFAAPTVGDKFEFGDDPAELRRLPTGIDSSLAGSSDQTQHHIQQQQQIPPPQLSRSHSLGHFAVSPSIHYAASSISHQAACSAFAPPPSSQLNQGYLQQLYAAAPSAAAQSGPVQLWMGDIEPWMDDDYIRLLWARMGESVAVKVIRDRLTGALANYCFVEVLTHADAERLLALYNGRPMPAPFDRLFRLNWASGMSGGLTSSALLPIGIGYSHQVATSSGVAAAGVLEGSSAALYAAAPGTGPLPMFLDGPEFSLFVGDLAPEVTDIQLVHEFRGRYASVRTAKIVTDPVTLQPRGYGFVRFADEADHQRALVEMNGKVIGSRAIRVSAATPKRMPTMSSFQQQQPADGALGRDATASPALSESSSDSNALYNPATDPLNTTVFVGGLMHPVGEDELHAFFAVYGDVDYCKIPLNRGCGFVTFAKRANAETAMRALNGHMLGGSRVRLSWGRSQIHARHNHRHHHHHHHHHRQQNSNGGSSSGANSHRNSVSDQNGLFSRRSVSLGKGIVAATAASATALPAPSSSVSTAPLGLGLCGALLAGASSTSMASMATDEKCAVAPTVYSAAVHSSISSHALAAMPSYIQSPPLQQQQHNHLLSGYSVTPQSAFYSLSPIHSAGTGAAPFVDGFENDTHIVPQAQQQQQQPHYTRFNHQQPLQYYYYQPQEQQMLATPITGYAPQGVAEMSPSITTQYGRQPLPPPPHSLGMRASGLFESMNPLQQSPCVQQHDYRVGDFASGGSLCSPPSNTMLPSMAACPSELLTRRLSALTLSNTARMGSGEISGLGGGPSPNASAAPTLNRRPSAGVIGQRRLSSKSSFYQPPMPHKSSSQLSMAQMWPTALESSPSLPLSLQMGEFQPGGALSTPASSARLSTSSLSFLAMTPSTLNHDNMWSADNGASRRQSSDDKQKRDSQDRLDLALDGSTIRII